MSTKRLLLLVGGLSALALFFFGGAALGRIGHHTKPKLALAGTPLAVGVAQHNAPVTLDAHGKPMVAEGVGGTGSGASGGAGGNGSGASPASFDLPPAQRPGWAPVGAAGSQAQAATAARASTSSGGGTGPGSATTPGASALAGTPAGGGTPAVSGATTTSGAGGATPTGTGAVQQGEPEYLRFTDPCAGDQSGDGGGEGCPDGTGGIVLIGGDDTPVAPPLAIVESWMGPAMATSATDRCPLGVDADGTVHTLVYTNVPATLTLTLDVQGEHHVVTAHPSDAEADRFYQRMLDGDTIDGSQANGVQTCVTFRSLPRSLDFSGDSYLYHPAVTGTDALGNSVSKPVGFLQMQVLDLNGHLDRLADDLSGEAPPTSSVPFTLGSVSTVVLPGNVSPRCPLGPNAGPASLQGQLAGILQTTLPGTFQLSVIDRGRTIPIGTFRTTGEERRLNHELLITGDAPATSGVAAVQTCLHLGDVDNPGHYYLEVHGTSDDGRTVDGRLPFTITDEAADALPSVTPGRPRPILLNQGDHFQVDLFIDGDKEQVHARALVRSGADTTGQSCTDVEDDALRHPRSQSQLTFLPRGVNASGGPIDPDSPGARFDTVVPIRVTPGEGGVLELCTWITTTPRGAFEPTVEQRDHFTFSEPRHLRYTIDLQSILAFRGSTTIPVEAHRYTVTALNWPGQPSRSFPPQDTLGEPEYADHCAVAHPRCHSPVPVLLNSLDNDVPAVTHLRITDTLGHSVRYNVATPSECLVGRPNAHGTPCAVGLGGHADYYDLPDNAGFLCISDCHGSRDMRLWVHPYAGPNGPPGPSPSSSATGVMSYQGSFRRSHLSLPVEPRISLNTSEPTELPASPGGRPGMRMVLHFDRPVTVHVEPELLSAPVSSCTTPPARDVGGPSAQPTLEFTNLCFGATYGFALTATDPAGGGVLQLPAAALRSTTSSFPVAGVDAAVDVTTDFGYRHLFAPRVDVSVAHRPVALTGLTAEAHSSCGQTAAPVHGAGSLEATHLGEAAHAEIYVYLTGCDGRGHELRAPLVLQLSDLLAGPTTYSATEDGVTVRLTITVHPDPGHPLPPAMPPPPTSP